MELQIKIYEINKVKPKKVDEFKKTIKRKLIERNEQVEHQLEKVIAFLDGIEDVLKSKQYFSKNREINSNSWANGHNNLDEQLLLIRKYAIWLNNQIKSITNSPFSYNKDKLTPSRLLMIENTLNRIAAKSGILCGVTMDQIVNFTRGRFDIENVDNIGPFDYGRFLELACHANSCYLHIHKNLPALLRNFDNKVRQPDLLSYAVMACLSRFLDPSSTFTYSEIYHSSMQNIEYIIPKVYVNPTFDSMRAFLLLIRLPFLATDHTLALKYMGILVNMSKILGVELRPYLMTNNSELVRDTSLEQHAIVLHGVDKMISQLKLIYKDSDSELISLPNYFVVSFFLPRQYTRDNKPRAITRGYENKIWGASVDIVNNCRKLYNSNIKPKNLNFTLRLPPSRIKVIFSNVVSQLPALKDKLSFSTHLCPEAYRYIKPYTFIYEDTNATCAHSSNLALFYSILAYNSIITLFYPSVIIKPYPNVFSCHDLIQLLKAAHHQSLLYLYSGKIHLQEVLLAYSKDNSPIAYKVRHSINMFMRMYPQPVAVGKVNYNAVFNRYNLANSLFNDLMFTYFVYLNVLCTLRKMKDLDLSLFGFDITVDENDKEQKLQIVELSLHSRLQHILAFFKLISSLPNLSDNFDIESTLSYIFESSANFDVPLLSTSN